MIGSDQNTKPSSTSLYTRSYTINSTSSADPPIKPKSHLYPSLHRSESLKLSDTIKGKVRSLCNVFEARRASKPPSSASRFQSKLKSEKSNSQSNHPSSIDSIQLPGTEDRIVIYFTSLRGIRRTYEDCYSVRMILKFFRVLIDERDISMDSEYRKELLSVLREKQVTLPQVFIKGKYVGGADVVKQLHESGQLAKMVKGLPVRAVSAWQVCEACGDVRFVPCANCSGSKKVFDEEDEVLKRCPECNENGLVRCPSCSS